MNIFPNLNTEWKQADEKKFKKLYQDTPLEKLAEIFKRPEEEIILMGLHVRKEQQDQEERERLMKIEGIEYDKLGRMKYNPSFHDRQGEKWTIEELEYLCKFIEIDGRESVCMALGRTNTTIASMISNLKRSGNYEYYKNLNQHY